MAEPVAASIERAWHHLMSVLAFAGRERVNRAQLYAQALRRMKAGR